MFPNADQLKRVVGVVVTKTSSPRIKPVGLLEELKKGSSDTDLLDKFISDGDQRVFSFPSPYDVGEVENPLPVEVKKRIFKFLETDRVSGLKHAPAVEAETEKLVIGLGYWFIEEKCRAIDKFATELEKSIPTILEDEEAIKIWKSRVTKIHEESGKDWKSFASCCKEVSKEVKLCAKVVADIEKLIPMKDFIEKVLSASQDAKDMNEKDKTLVGNCCYRFVLILNSLDSKDQLRQNKISKQQYDKQLLDAEKEKIEVQKALEKALDDLQKERDKFHFCTLL